MKSQLNHHHHTVSGNHIEVKNQIVWDKATVEVMQTVSDGLKNMTELFKSQKIILPSVMNFDNVNGASVSNCSIQGFSESTGFGVNTNDY